MCFSAEASFGAGIVLTTIGFFTLKKVSSNNQILFACIPFLFAVQQFSECIVWLTLENDVFQSLEKVATYIFLIFAQIVWPLLVPISILLLKKGEKYAAFQKVLVVIGILTATYLSLALLLFPVKAEISNLHIVYHQNYPFSHFYIIGALYVLSTILPSFLSSIKGMKLLGTTILISCIIAVYYYESYLVSVWCFFASLISISVYRIINKQI